MLIKLGKKRLGDYRGLVMKADEGLHEQVAAVVREAVAQGGSILDLGAGEGAFSARLSDMGYRVTASDLDPQALKAAGVEFARLDFNDEDAFGRFLGEHRQSFDAVCALEVIEHIEDPWRFVRTVRDFLRPGGRVFITTPNIASWLSRVVFLLQSRFHQFGPDDLSYGHIAPISPGQLRLLLEREGFLDVSVKPAGTLPPLYFDSLAMTIVSLLALPLRPFQKGLLDGWCLLAAARKA
ncbi:MAG: methyltransferase domain-containing protein [Verrucomicrobiota bacterium]|nr:methyltransferase domain-containing protein [Verrucomicrobiota bacterium]